jgi:hypothetical protein
MWPLFKSLLTTDTAQWYETLPFVIGFIFVGIELIVLIAKGVSLRHYAHRLGSMLGEGITVCLLPMYGMALAFDRTLALSIAEKNSKVLAGAMLIAFTTLIIHILEDWFSSSSRQIDPLLGYGFSYRPAFAG